MGLMRLAQRWRDGDISTREYAIEFAAAKKRKSKADNSKSKECFRDDGSSYRIPIAKVCGGAKTQKKPISTPKGKAAVAGVKKAAKAQKDAGSFPGAIGGLKNGKKYDITPEMAKAAQAMGVSDRQLASGRVPKAVQADLIKEFDRLSAGGNRGQTAELKPKPKPGTQSEVDKYMSNLEARRPKNMQRELDAIEKEQNQIRKDTNGGQNLTKEQVARFVALDDIAAPLRRDLKQVEERKAKLDSEAKNIQQSLSKLKADAKRKEQAAAKLSKAMGDEFGMNVSKYPKARLDAFLKANDAAISAKKLSEENEARLKDLKAQSERLSEFGLEDSPLRIADDPKPKANAKPEPKPKAKPEPEPKVEPKAKTQETSSQPKPDPKIKKAIADALDDYAAEVEREVNAGGGILGAKRRFIEISQKFVNAVKKSDMRTDPIRNYETFKYEFSKLHDIATGATGLNQSRISDIMVALSPRISKQDARRWALQMQSDNDLIELSFGGDASTSKGVLESMRPHSVRGLGATFVYARRLDGSVPPTDPTEEERLKDERLPEKPRRTQKISDVRDFSNEVQSQINDLIEDKNFSKGSNISMKELREKMSGIVSPQDFDKWMIEAQVSGAIEASHLPTGGLEGSISPGIGEPWNVVRVAR